jgi:hypothetical protein
MKVSKTSTIIVSTIILAAAAVGFWNAKVRVPESESALIYKPIDRLTEKGVEEIERQEAANYGIKQGLEKYESGRGFSFWHPGFKASAVPNNNGELLTFDKGPVSFQIFIMPFDEPGPITPERIWQDVPDMEINNAREADLDGVETVVFNSYDEALGETFEVWLVYKGRLYQIMTTREQEKLLIEILNTWNWK